jgi:hypothetical protein
VEAKLQIVGEDGRELLSFSVFSMAAVVITWPFFDGRVIAILSFLHRNARF